MKFKVALSFLILILGLLVGPYAEAQGPDGKQKRSRFSSFYLSGGSLGDLGSLAEGTASPGACIPEIGELTELLCASPELGCGLELASADVEASIQLGLGATWCLNESFALDFGLRYGSADLKQTYEGFEERFDPAAGAFSASSFLGLVESAAEIFSGHLTGRFYPLRACRVRPWLSLGLRGYSLRTDDGRLTTRLRAADGGELTSDLGETVALPDVEKVDLQAGLGFDFELGDRFGLTLSGEQGLDLGWSAGLRLVFKVGGRGGCGRCSKSDEDGFPEAIAAASSATGDDDDDNDEDKDDEELCRSFLSREVPLARIEAPPVTTRRSLALDPSALPAGARAFFPAFDGDHFFVSFAGGRPDPADLADRVIAPTLRAIGFEGGLEALREPAAEGVAVPGADLAALAEALRFEAASGPGVSLPGTPAMIAALALEVPPSAAVETALAAGLGMSFAELAADVTGGEVLYPFHQMHDGTPIEHTLILASGRPGEGITALRGSLINHYVVANRVAVDRPVRAADRAMRAIPGVQGVELPAAGEGPVLVLLPYGSAPDGRIRLRHAYRMKLLARYCRLAIPFLVWLDAEDGSLLTLTPLAKAGGGSSAGETVTGETVDATAAVFNRDPGVGTTVSLVQVDPPTDGKYSLASSGGLKRVDFQQDGFDQADFALAAGDEEGSRQVVSFDRFPINDAGAALCGAGDNKQFQQVSFFTTVSRYLRYARGLEVEPVFALDWEPGVESRLAACGAYSNMSFGACEGYRNPACPDFSDGSRAQGNCMNFAHDNTVIAHEMGHNVTMELSNRRDFEWCRDEACALPVGWGALHDLADFWADHFESTNCIAGWACKNVGGVDASLKCASHSEAGGMPRLHELPLPFDPAAPGDHFPEHRRVAEEEYRAFGDPGGQVVEAEYADMQIAAAALWELQLGMRSKSRSAGLALLAPRLTRALGKTGFLGSVPPPDDLGIYRYLSDLALELVDQWAAPALGGAHLTSEVTASLARAGLFLLPYPCLDSDPATADPEICPSGEGGGDAVIDVADNDPGDDYEIRGVRHPEVDTLRLGGPAPTFQVWTGPLYRFGDGGAAVVTGPAPCNRRYRIDVSPDPGFAAARTVDSGWIDVSGDPGAVSPPGCYGSWTPNEEQWRRLQAGGHGTRLYYRVTTRDASGGNERRSTAPGGGLWEVPPAYAVLTTDGSPHY